MVGSRIALAVHGLRGEGAARDPVRVERDPEAMEMRELRTEEEADAVFTEEVALLYKHSSRCPISLMAQEEGRRFAGGAPAISPRGAGLRQL